MIENEEEDYEALKECDVCKKVATDVRFESIVECYICDSCLEEHKQEEYRK